MLDFLAKKVLTLIKMAGGNDEMCFSSDSKSDFDSDDGMADPVYNDGSSGGGKDSSEVCIVS